MPASKPGPEDVGRQVVGIAAKWAARGIGVKGAVAAAPIIVLVLCFSGLFFVSASSPAEGECQVAGGSTKGIPANYIPWLQKAAVKYKLGPRGFSIVAAIHYRESDFGRSTLPGVAPGTTNEFGAMGPGQFLEESWPPFGVDADGDGVKDPYSIPDSVFATANTLHQAGAPGNWHDAIFSYNHAEWYVQEVLEKAKEFEGEVQITCTETSLLGVGDKSLVRMEEVAKWIESRRIHYCWGGGHDTKPGPSNGEYCWDALGAKVFGAGEKGLDCSGAVRWLLVLTGFKDKGPMVSGDFAAAYKSGPGQAVTIWSNSAHVFIEINGRQWGTASANYAHGPAFGPQSSAGFAPSHPEGL